MNKYSLIEISMLDNLSFPPKKINYAYVASGLAAFGTALQNYQAVALSLTDLASHTLPASQCLDWSIQLTALGAGGLCSGVVNFWMNVELLEDFYIRMNKVTDIKAGRLETDKVFNWDEWIKIGGILVFIITGILFGLMAFTFAMTGPLAILSVAVGVFVAGIMTIQEVETWLSSYDDSEIVTNDSLSGSELIGKTMGHILAIGNVIALSLSFTLGLTTALMALQVAIIPALITGFSVAFTFGAFTEYFFYKTYLESFCQNFNEKMNKMLSKPNAWFDFLCVSINALVNTAYAYAAIKILTDLLVVASISLPPAAVITTTAIVLALFAGGASFILGLGFKERQYSKESLVSVYKDEDNSKSVYTNSPYVKFSKTISTQHKELEKPSTNINEGLLQLKVA